MVRLVALACVAGFIAPLSAATPLPRVPPGFKVELVLQAPEIEAPTALCVAPNGDVYFAEDPMDMRGPPTKNIDNIWLLKGGDPKKKVLFADKMWAVMGMEIVRDKLYVVHAPHVTVFTLGADGKAKKREELFDDLGPKVAGVPSFNDHIPSGIRAGMDGWLYVSIGDKGIPKMTRKEKDRGSVHIAEGRWRHTKEGHHISLEGGGVIRFRPDGSGLEVFASGTRNHLDVPLDEHDRIFVRDNTDDGLGWWTRLMYLPRGAFMGYPWAYTRRPKETLPMVRDFGGGSPCGGWVYLDDGLPAMYRDRIFHCEWGQGKVLAVKVAPDGAGFKFVDQLAFMEPGGVKDFRPFTLRPTADGRGFYVTDWGYSGWLAKAKAGRIWKLTYTKCDVKPRPRGKDTDSIEQLIKSLDHPAHGERLRAQRALAVRGNEATRLLRKQWGSLSKLARRHGLWVLYETRDDDLLSLALEASREKEEDLRLEAVRALAGVSNPLKKQSVAERLQTILQSDPVPSVRMQAAITLRSFGPQSGMALMSHLSKERDPFVRYALVRTLKEKCDWKDVGDYFRVGSWTIASQPAEACQGVCSALAGHYDLEAIAVLRRLLQCKGPSFYVDIRRQAVETLGRLYKDRRPYAGTWWGTQPAGRKPPPRVVAWEGTPLVRDTILGALGDKDADVRNAALTALVAMSDPATLGPLVKRFGAEKDGAARADIVRAVAGLHVPEAVEFLAGVLHERKNPEALRLEAAIGLTASRAPTAAASLVRVAVATEPVALQIRALESLGTLKAREARTACAVSLKSVEPLVRRAAAGALGQLGDPTASALLLPLLKDKEIRVRTAAIQALGALKARDAVPALIQATSDPTTQFEAITALARMPDKGALSAYLTGLGSKNADLRNASRQALIAVHDAVLPALEQLVKKSEVPAALLPELRSIYHSYAPVLSWRLIGPFPDDSKAHPPEKELKLDTVYKVAGKDVKWRTAKGDIRSHGRINLAALIAPDSDVVAYGYAEIESRRDRDAELLLGSDDTLTVWLDGKKVFAFDGNRGWAYDQNKAKVRLHEGTNKLLVKCGNRSGPWEFSVAVSGDVSRYAFLDGGGKKLTLEAFRAYARKTPGDAARGHKLFMDPKGLACVKCHAVAGAGGHVGPDLAGIGLKYKRDDLMTSILEPSKVIAQGYETIIIETTKGQKLTGVFKGETTDAVNLTDAEGKPHRILKKNIEERSFSPVSTMPNGLNEGMTLQDFADLIAYLEARREEKVVPKK